jgi:hypothetical protein
MARALNQIIAELDTVYKPQRDLYNKQISGIDPQLQAEEQGLMAQKEDSFRQITDQANRRGMFYSGLPIAEEQRYTGQQFLPAVAGLRSKYATQRFGLQETLAKIAQEQRSQAYGIQDREEQRDERLRQEAEQRRQFDAQMAAQRAAASGGGGGGGYSFGGGGGATTTGGGGKVSGVKVAPGDQQLYNAMFVNPQGGNWSDRDLVSDYNQTLIGARNGNTRDKQKLQFYHSFRSDLFGGNVPASSLQNAPRF